MGSWSWDRGVGREEGLGFDGVGVEREDLEGWKEVWGDAEESKEIGSEWWDRLSG
jgi:hypothetical protein